MKCPHCSETVPDVVPRDRLNSKNDRIRELEASLAEAVGNSDGLFFQLGITQGDIDQGTEHGIPDPIFTAVNRILNGGKAFFEITVAEVVAGIDEPTQYAPARATDPLMPGAGPPLHLLAGHWGAGGCI